MLRCDNKLAYQYCGLHHLLTLSVTGKKIEIHDRVGGIVTPGIKCSFCAQCCNSYITVSEYNYNYCKELNL